MELKSLANTLTWNEGNILMIITVYNIQWNIRNSICSAINKCCDMRIWRSMCPIRICKSIIPIFQVFSGPIILKVWKNKSDRSRVMNVFGIKFGENDRFDVTDFRLRAIRLFMDNKSAVQAVRTKARWMSVIPFCTSFVCNELLIGYSLFSSTYYWTYAVPKPMQN